MKRFSMALVAAGFLAAVGSQAAHAQATRYWDVNGTEIGATPGGNGIGDPAPGTGWDAASLYWNSEADGGGGGTITAWTPGDHAVFSAGDDVGTDPSVAGAFVTITDTQTAASVLIEEGYIAFRGGTVDTGEGTVTINEGATLDIDSTLRLNLEGGKVVLNGGTIMQSNPGQAGTFIGGGAAGLKGLEVNGMGFIGYDDGDGIPDNKVSIFTGVITGTGGMVDNGGAGTLVKIGPDQIGIGATDQGGQHSQSLFTFAKLEVREGAYRLRHQTFDSTVQETAFGAVPLAELPDAITLDGGGIGSNTTVTLHEFRGITIGPNGGYLDHGATAGLNIPGPLTAAPGALLTIGSPTSTFTGNVTFTLSNPNNVNTFQGDIHVRRGVLQLDSSLNAANFSGEGLDAATVGTVSVAADQTFTFGSGNEDTSFDGVVAGAGTFRKVGSGTTTFTGVDNTHSGNTVVEGGTLSIVDPYLADGGDVFLTTGAILNLNFAETDTIDQLFFDNLAQEAGVWGAIGSGAANETAFLTGTGLLQVTTGAVAGLLGDYNENGVVDAADYVVWRNNETANNPLPNDNNLATQAERYDLWRANFGNATPGGGSALNAAGAVPEPATIVMLLATAALVGAGRRQR